MKLFKRKNKKDELLEPEKKPSRKSSLNGSLLVGITLSLISIFAAFALVAWSNWQNEQQQQQQQANLLRDSALASINQRIKLIDSDASAIAANPVLIQLVLNQDDTAIELLERSLRQRASVADVYISARGKASRQSERPAPISYAALDMIANAENDNQVPAEFVRAAGQSFLYKAHSIKHQDKVLGTVLVVYHGSMIADVLPTVSQGKQLVLNQKLADTPVLQITSSGHSDSDTPTSSRTLNPNWQLLLLQNNQDLPALSELSLILIALAIATGGVLSTLIVLHGASNKRINKDCNLFSQLIQDWQLGKPLQIDKIRTPSLQALAASLSQTSAKRGDIAEPAPAVNQPSNSDDILALKKGQNMEVEEIDDFEVFDTIENTDQIEDIEEAEYIDEPEEFNDILDIDILDEQDDPFGLAEDPREQSRQQVSEAIFRAYDIRGVVGENLNQESAYWIGRAIAAQCRELGQPSLSVGRDGRLSSPQLSQALIQGLNEGGCEVYDLGVVPTPVVYFASHTLDSNSCVMVTGSHNPPEYNGFKVVINGQTLANEQIKSLYQRIQSNQLSQGEASCKEVDILPSYIERISNDVAMARPLKLVIDCGNGAAGVVATQLFEALGCTLISLNTEVDGNFPAHHPDPSQPENLQQLIEVVTREKADLGIAFDGDGDRLGVVTSSGNIIYPDRLMMLLAKDMVSRNPGADVVFDVKCSRRLAALISGYGGRPVMWKTGHSLMKAKMQEVGALLGGEMSGHIFYSERWYGFDDGLYAAARLLEILALEERSSEQVFAAFPSSKSTPELHLRVTDEIKFKIIAALQQKGQWGDGKVNELDGVRVDFSKSWGLVRASNTTPNLVLRFEGDTDEDLHQVKEVFRQQLQNLVPNLPWPF